MKRYGQGMGGSVQAIHSPFDVSRRQILCGASLGGLLATAGGASASWAAMSRNEAVLSFHLDEPWVDGTGLAQPYRPPSGCRSGARGARPGEEALRRLNCYL